MTDKAKATARILAGLVAGNPPLANTPSLAASMAWHLAGEIESLDLEDKTRQALREYRSDISED
jgi:hypothetical protein